jgi:hypothetical protein
LKCSYPFFSLLPHSSISLTNQEKGGSLIYDGKTQHFGGPTEGLRKQRDYIWFAVFIRKNYEHKEDLSWLVQNEIDESSRLVNNAASGKRIKNCKKLQKKILVDGISDFIEILYSVNSKIVRL